MTKTKWTIWVSGYGSFDFEGTKAEAEEMRAHKARWEGGASLMWKADMATEADRLAAETATRWSARS